MKKKSMAVKIAFVMINLAVFSVFLVSFIGVVIIIITLLTDFRARLRKGNVIIDSIIQGVLMFFGSVIFGVLMIVTFVCDRLFQYDLSHNFYDNFSQHGYGLTKGDISDRMVDMPFLSVYSQYLDTLCIFLIYIAGLTIIFGTIYGMLAKTSKSVYISKMWIANIGPLIVLFICLGIWADKHGEEVIVSSVVLSAFFLSSVFIACIFYFFIKSGKIEDEEEYFIFFVGLPTLIFIYKTVRTLWELHVVGAFDNVVIMMILLILLILSYFFAVMAFALCLPPIFNTESNS